MLVVAPAQSTLVARTVQCTQTTLYTTVCHHAPASTFQEAASSGPPPRPGRAGGTFMGRDESAISAAAGLMHRTVRLRVHSVLY